MDGLLDHRLTQEEFGQMVGISQQAVSALVADGVLPKEASAGIWLKFYCDRLREQAAGRLGDSAGGLDLVQERAALAREQRISQELKNQVARGEYAPIGLLADVLGQAASAVVDQFEQLEGALRKACPDIDDAVLTTVLNTTSRARNQWIKSTAKLVDRSLDQEQGSEVEDLDDGSETWLLTGKPEAVVAGSVA